MGYNRGGTRRKARLKRAKREELRLAKAAEAQNPTAAPQGKETQRSAPKATPPKP
jgi:hypothetical protein